MNMIKKYTGRSLWLAGLMLTTLIAGCGGGSSSSSNPITTPTVVETAPKDGAIDVALNSKVVVTFSEAMDASTISTTDTANFTNFTVIAAGGSELRGIVEYDAASKTAVFTPDLGQVVASTVYTATVTTAVKSATGVALAANKVWSFTSGTAADALAPTVVSTNPLDGVSNVVINPRVSATFSEAILPSTVTASTFTLSAGGTSVSGVVSYSNKVATFTPTDNLAIDTLYTATLTTGITDIANPAKALVAYTWTFTTGSTVAQGPAAVDLGTAGNYAILAEDRIITATATTEITGDIAISPAAASFIQGFGLSLDATGCFSTTSPTSLVTGKVYAADYNTGSCTTPAELTTAVGDMMIAYNDARDRKTPDFLNLGAAGDIGGQTMVPGLYKYTTSVLINSNVTLSGGPNDVWIFQIEGDLTQASGTIVKLAGGALPKNIFWQVKGGAGAVIDTTAHFEGVILAATDITLNAGATVNGRLLSQVKVILNDNKVTQP